MVEGNYPCGHCLQVAALLWLQESFSSAGNPAESSPVIVTLLLGPCPLKPPIAIKCHRPCGGRGFHRLLSSERSASPSSWLSLVLDPFLSSHCLLGEHGCPAGKAALSGYELSSGCSWVAETHCCVLHKAGRGTTGSDAECTVPSLRMRFVLG